MWEDFLLSYGKSVQEIVEKKLLTEVFLENQTATSIIFLIHILVDFFKEVISLLSSLIDQNTFHNNLMILS